ncbi:alpha/beta hydrolase [Bradyrhizobium sp. CCBAU 51765]|uniref:PHA/PHB synthase family protein n=1 Tax=Bradyrhizobium sp. CCBAU 51765 TaxID=1325102 RepID=UPI001FEF2300|nr:alpha/beta fold hydrolase [Bradyrhizobium sp. CCBAU 51765]
MQATLGRSPLSVLNAYSDWLGHLAVAPGLRQQLLEFAIQRSLQLWQYATGCAVHGGTAPVPCVGPLPQDNRFSNPAWSTWPFNVVHQAFLMQEEWWGRATTAVPGVSPHNAREVSFLARQVLDQFAPSNFVATNPVVLRKTLESGGRNLWDGACNFVDDLQRAISRRPVAGTEAYRVGETIACTPGSVIFRNELIELIQYSPMTDKVHPEPVLIVPAWIMKYYILDLSPENSLVRHLLEAGHTVFMISWRNPRPEHRDLGMDDYLSLGIDAALAGVKAVVPDHPVHAVGYCLGGTLLAIAAAALARREEHALKTLTLLAAQTDFADAGELTLFVDESEVTFLEDLMWQRGLLEARQMAGAFHLLRSNDLIWSRVVRDYLLGGRMAASDLMTWNADGTRMPYRMHSEYLRQLFLNNDLAAGRYVVGGMPVGLSNIDVPMFVVATAWDHVAPWKSVYKIHLQADVDLTFVLTTGGHNVGIVNPPKSSTRQYRMGTQPHTATYISPDHWLETHDSIAGSWWGAWVDWLKTNSSAPGAPPTMGATAIGLSPIEGAPGSYVFDR